MGDGTFEQPVKESPKIRVLLIIKVRNRFMLQFNSLI